MNSTFLEKTCTEQELWQAIFYAIGKLNKQVATTLDVSVRTVEIRRQRIMKKLDGLDLASRSGLAGGDRSAESSI